MDELTSKIEDILNILKTYEEKIRAFEAQVRVWGEKERQLTELDNSLKVKESSLVSKQTSIEEQARETEVAKAYVKKMQGQIDKDRIELKELDERRVLVLKQEKDLEDRKETYFAEIAIKARTMERERELIEREKAADTKRKQMLDLREQKIKTREHQLQMATEM